jgi:cysteine synthase
LQIFPADSPVGNTSFVKIDKLAPPNINLFLKVEAFNPLGSVKDRPALGVIEDAERNGRIKPSQAVIGATSGNTGIGLYACRLALRRPIDSIYRRWNLSDLERAI